MDRGKLYLSWLFALGALGYGIRILVDLRQGTVRGTLFDDIAMAIILLLGAVRFRIKWRRGTVPQRVEQALTGTSFACLAIVVYYFLTENGILG